MTIAWILALSLVARSGQVSAQEAPWQGRSVLGEAGEVLPQVQDAQAQVRAAEAAFAKTMSDRDFDAFGTFVSEEAIFFGGSGALRGKDAVLAGWAPYFDGPDAPFSWEPETVEVLESGTLAHSSGPVKDPQGNVVGTFNSVWRLEADGRWRVVFDKGCPAGGG